VLEPWKHRRGNAAGPRLLLLERRRVPRPVPPSGVAGAALDGLRSLISDASRSWRAAIRRRRSPRPPPVSALRSWLRRALPGPSGLLASPPGTDRSNRSAARPQWEKLPARGRDSCCEAAGPPCEPSAVRFCPLLSAPSGALVISAQAPRAPELYPSSPNDVTIAFALPLVRLCLTCTLGIYSPPFRGPPLAPRWLTDLAALARCNDDSAAAAALHEYPRPPGNEQRETSPGRAFLKRKRAIHPLPRGNPRTSFSRALVGRSLPADPRHWRSDESAAPALDAAPLRTCYGRVEGP